MMGEMKFLAAIAVGGGFASFGGAMGILTQAPVLDPNTALMPVGVVVGLFVAAITATVKVVRALDSWLHKMGELEERVQHLEEKYEGD